MPSPTLTRRALIAGAGTAVVSAALAAPYVNAVRGDEVCSIGADPRERMIVAVAELRAAMTEYYGRPVQVRTDLMTKGGVAVFGCLLDPRDYINWYVDEHDTPADHPLRLSHRAAKRASYGVPAAPFAHRNSPLLTA
ncbi:hypothetical protein [Devosia sp. 2618]|uniref:hypothetical protein n=1 Tax=Devosia sp. 2618 TaxID=3156454 RepID=UPI003392A3EC